jgi:hypothetical protein
MPASEPRAIAVASPGGFCRQFKVQYREQNEPVWHQSAVFQNDRLARQRAQQLRQSGLEARVIHFRLPVAA